MMGNYTNEQEKNRLQEQLDSDKLRLVNIIVAGITGVGKSTLINAIFGDEYAKTGSGKPVTEHMDMYSSEEVPIKIWDTVGLELNAEKTEKSIHDIQNTIAEKAKSNDEYNTIHAIWYCINSGSKRYQGKELEFIKKLHDCGVPFIIVLTQCTAAEEQVKAFEDEIRKINLSMGMQDIEIVQVCAKDFEMRNYSIPAFGLKDLVELTVEKMPKYLKESFIAAQRVSQEQKREAAEKMICEYVQAAKEGFWDKIPFINIISANNRIKNMLSKLGQIYNTNLSQDNVNEIVTVIESKKSFWTLINPFDMTYGDRLKETLSSSGGYTGQSGKLIDNRNKVASMIAFYGYTMVQALEESWNGNTKEKVEEIDEFLPKLKNWIADYLEKLERKLRG